MHMCFSFHTGSFQYLFNKILYARVKIHEKFRDVFRKQPFADVLGKGVFLKFSQYSPENILIHKAAFRLRDCNFIKKRLQLWYFALNVVKFLRTAFFIEHLRLLIEILIFFRMSEWMN